MGFMRIGVSFGKPPSCLSFLPVVTGSHLQGKGTGGRAGDAQLLQRNECQHIKDLRAGNGHQQAVS